MIYERIKLAKVVPVIAIEDVGRALALADALIQGGLPVAEITFLYNPAHTRGDIGIQSLLHSVFPFRVPPIKISRVIRARSDTIPAAETANGNLCNDAGFFIVFHCVLRADGFAWCVMIALLAGKRKIHGTILGKRMVIVDFIHAHPCYARAVGCLLRCRWNVIFYRASKHTIAAAGAAIKVDDHAVTGRSMIWFCRHYIF